MNYKYQLIGVIDSIHRILRFRLLSKVRDHIRRRGCGGSNHNGIRKTGNRALLLKYSGYLL